MMTKKKSHENKFNFLEAIYGNNIPKEIKTDKTNPLVTVYTLGSPDIKILAKTALTLLS